jgi:hypothetical protein
MGRRPTRGGWGGGALEAGAGRGGSQTRSEGRRTRGVAGGEDVGGSVDDRFREASGGGESRGTRRKVAVGEDDGGGGGGGHDDDDGSGSGTKKWPSAGGGGSLLLYIDKPLVPGCVTNRDKRGACCHDWSDDSGLKGDFAREPPKGKISLFSPGWCYHPRQKAPLLSRVVTPPGTQQLFCVGH